MRQLEEENLTLKTLVADLSLDKAMLQDVFAGTSARMRGGIYSTLRDQRLCGQPEFVQVSFCGDRRLRVTSSYQGNHRNSGPHGYRRVHVMLRREGWRDNHKRIYRLYSVHGLSLHLKRPRHSGDNLGCIRIMFGTWTLFLKLWLSLLTIIDLCARKCLGSCVGQNLRSTEVAEMLKSIAL